MVSEVSGKCPESVRTVRPGLWLRASEGSKSLVDVETKSKYKDNASRLVPLEVRMHDNRGYRPKRHPHKCRNAIMENANVRERIFVAGPHAAQWPKCHAWRYTFLAAVMH